MNQKSEAVKRARRKLIQQTLDKICETRDFSELKTNTYVVLAHLWLHKKAEEENFMLSYFSHITHKINNCVSESDLILISGCSVINRVIGMPLSKISLNLS